jgi:hypothetical protein
MKICPSCGRLKSLDEFHKGNRHGRQVWCKACRKAYDSAYYARNKRRIVARKRERERELTEWTRGLKEGVPCADCGGTFHPAAMEWDHLPGTEKRGAVSNLARFLSQASILAEIEKCELVCANCHAVRTYNRLNGA